MGGGLMQLVAYGAQDVYLTGNPQITLFKVVYRRHTNFSVECIELPLETAKPGGKPQVQILRNGDLASRSYLRVTLPELVPSNADLGYQGQVAWVRRLGHAMIRSVEIQIGGAPIDKHYGVWLDVWYELTHPTGQERGYKKMIGDVEELTSLQAGVRGGYNLFVPLQFWFCRNYGLALPLIALQYHDVRLNFELESLDRLYVYSRGCGTRTAPSFQSLQYTSAGVLIDYVYLDSEERRRFAQVGHEYLIEQLQTDGEQQLSQNTSTAAPSVQSFTLNFNHPCKEFVWVHKLGAFNGAGGADNGWFLSYTDAQNTDFAPGAWDSAIQEAANSLAKAMVSVDAVAPWTAIDANVQTLAFNPANEPITTAQVGPTTWKFISVNTTNIVPADVQNVHVLTNPVTQGQINLANGLVDVTVELDYRDQVAGTAGLPVVTVTVTENNLSLENLSVPLVPGASTNFSDRRLDDDKCNDVHVIQPHNYGVRLDGKGNIVLDGLLILNGHDRFARREGNYFNFVQPYQHHTRTPADGVNVYSFALHPEQHQPTGTANLSRIDNTKLNYRTQDPLRQNMQRFAALNYAVGTSVWIFATNYNVLRIMSGKLAFLLYNIFILYNRTLPCLKQRSVGARASNGASESTDHRGNR